MKRSKFKDALGLICGKWDGDYTEYYKSGKVKIKGVMADPGYGWNASLKGKGFGNHASAIRYFI